MTAHALLDPAAPVDILTERLGWCALHFLWQGTGIALLLAALLWLCQRGTAELRYACCGMALLLMAAAPLITWQHLTSAGSPVSSPHPDLLTDITIQPVSGLPPSEDPSLTRAKANHPRRSLSLSPQLETALPPPIAAIPSDSPAAWPSWLGMAWLLGAGLMGIARFCGLTATVLLVRRATRASEALTLQTARMANRFGLRRVPIVKITSQLISPAVAGILRPVLLLPAGALAGLSPQQLDFILAHEFAHIRRQDFLIGLLQAAVETLLFFHPAVWWVSRRMTLEREHACDDAALRITGNPREGAQALARLAELSLQSGPVLAPAAGGQYLLHRVRRLLAPSPRRSGSSPWALAPLLVAGLVIPLLMLQKAKSQAPDPVPGTSAPVADPFVMRGSITDRNGVILAESSISTWIRNGVTYTGKKRNYPLGALASHLLGYTKQHRDETSPETGIAGVEKLADAELRSVPAKDGKAQPAIMLTIDSRIQQICTEALRGGGVGRGAAVILDVRNGDILAMVSLPDFDPNQFVPFITAANWKNLNDDETQPMPNRALRGYPPGSTFKIITALASGESGSWANSYTCTGSVDYGGRPYKCWIAAQGNGSHGALLLPEALKCSCNCYFYQLGNATGIGPIATMAGKFGMSQDASFRLGFPTSDFSPTSDFMPDEAWWARQNKGPWTESKTANVATGQGEVLATPLQMAGVAAAIANNGKIWEPAIIAKSRQNANWQSRSPELRHDLLKEGVPAEALNAIRQGMFEVVHADDGATGKQARSSLISIAGKTGTAQKWRIDPSTQSHIMDNHTQFIGFAPFDNPRYAFSIVIANGKAGGSTAAPVARRIMEKITLMEAGKLTINPMSQPPSKGHFNFLESIAYPDDLPGSH